jgi:hypothetical protein
MNLYTYVRNNPVNWVDPWGLITFFREAGYWLELGIYWNEVYEYAHEQRSWGHSNYGGQENSPMRHCVVSCIMAKRYGTDTARIAGYANEAQGALLVDLPIMWNGIMKISPTEREEYLAIGRLTGTVPWAFQLDDLENNERGFKCAKRECEDKSKSDKENCIECCKGN